MNKAFLIWLLAAIFLATVPSAQAQPGKVARLGYYSSRDPGTESGRAEAIRQALRELGYSEGQNLAIEYRYGSSSSGRAAAGLADLVRLKVDVIVVAGGYNVIVAAKEATKTIPIVMAGEGLDPVKGGIVESIARPGGNITGVTNISRILGGKRLELLKEAVTRLSRVAVLYNPDIPGTTREVKEEIPVVTRALKLTPQFWEVRVAEDFDRVFTRAGKERIDGLYVPGGGSIIGTNMQRIVDLANRHRVPAIYQSRDIVEQGGLMSYGADLTENYKRVAYFIDKILKGAKPADLPVEQPTKFEFVVNLKTAKQIGLNIQPEVLARATRVIR